MASVAPVDSKANVVYHRNRSVAIDFTKKQEEVEPEEKNILKRLCFGRGPNRSDYRDWPYWRFLLTFRNETPLLPMLVTVSITILMCALRAEKPELYFYLDPIGHSLMIIPLGFLLVFRVSLSYGRWWTGRNAVGIYILAGRDLASKVMEYFTIEPAKAEAVNALRKEILQKLLAGMALSARSFSKRDTIETGKALEDIRQVPAFQACFSKKELEKLHNHTHSRPLIVFTWMRKLIIRSLPLLQSEFLLPGLEQNIASLVDSWQTCATIGMCPFPFAFSHQLHVLLILWTFSLPFVITEPCAKAVFEYGNVTITTDGAHEPYTGTWAAVGFAFVLSLTLFGLNGIAQQLEDPFGDDFNDIDMMGLVEGLKWEIEHLAAEVMPAKDLTWLQGADVGREVEETFIEKAISKTE